jgi:hypothetical protein
MDTENENNDSSFLSTQEMLDSGDPVLVEYAQSLQGNSAPATESVEENDATQGVETDEAKQPEQDVVQNTDEQEAVDGVYAKDGKNIMPFSVVEDARRQARESNEALETLRAEQSDLQANHEKLMRQLELAQQKGVKLPTLPEDEKITDEQISELEDIGPEFGIMARQLRLLNEKIADNSNHVASAAKAAAPAAPAQNPEYQEASQAVNRNPAIQEILGDANMKAAAVSIEQSLMNDPRFASLDARYAEVAKRVGGAFGVDFGAKYGRHTIQPNAGVPDPIPASPESLSELPNADFAQTGKSTTEVFASKSEAELSDDLSRMSQAQIEEMMGGL